MLIPYNLPNMFTDLRKRKGVIERTSSHIVFEFPIRHSSENDKWAGECLIFLRTDVIQQEFTKIPIFVLSLSVL